MGNVGEPMHSVDEVGNNSEVIPGPFSLVVGLSSSNLEVELATPLEEHSSEPRKDQDAPTLQGVGQSSKKVIDIAEVAKLAKGFRRREI